MAAICFDCSVFEDLRLRALSDEVRAAFPVVAVRLQSYGDGGLSDRELQAGLLGPEQFAELAGALLGWGWLKRDAAGRLRRSGALAPVSADAQRMRNRRGQCAAKSQCGANADRTETEQKPNKYRTFSEQTANAHCAPAEHEADSLTRVRTYASESESDSESDSELTEGSDQIGSDRNPAWKSKRTDSERNPLPVPFQAHPAGSAPRTPLFDDLRGEGCSEELLAVAAKRVGEHNLWKANYVRKVVANLAAEGDRADARALFMPVVALTGFDALLERVRG